jgi:hypothetical protein
MELSRIGSNRKELRKKAFESAAPQMTFDAAAGSLKMVVRSADGMGTTGQYDYTVTLGPDDLRQMLKLLASERSAFQPSELQSVLESSASALLRLLAGASSLPFQLAPTEEDKRLQAARAKLAERNAAQSNN